MSKIYLYIWLKVIPKIYLFYEVIWQLVHIFLKRELFFSLLWDGLPPWRWIRKKFFLECHIFWLYFVIANIVHKIYSHT